MARTFAVACRAARDRSSDRNATAIPRQPSADLQVAERPSEERRLALQLDPRVCVARTALHLAQNAVSEHAPAPGVRCERRGPAKAGGSGARHLDQMLNRVLGDRALIVLGELRELEEPRA